MLVRPFGRKPPVQKVRRHSRNLAIAFVLGHADNLKIRNLMCGAPATLLLLARTFPEDFLASLDHLMPHGSPVFLAIVILLLLIVNGALLAARIFCS
jgi:hypothetical protein